MSFRNREEAALLLAARLSGYRSRNPLVLGIPRGAVPMAAIIAERLQGEVDVVLVHKLRAPGQPELAIGSVHESGGTYLSNLVQILKIDPEYIEQERQIQLQSLSRRRHRYAPLLPPSDPAGRLVIVVDDGIATGATMIAALRSMRARQPESLVAAAAVAPPEALRRMSREADRIVCLETPDVFFAVGEFFADFSQVSDEQVAEILQQSHQQQAQDD